MPIYEYACKSCGEHLEVSQSFTDDPLTACPACGGQLRKVFGSIGIAFKGSGFYRTDARSGSATSNGTGDKAETGEKAEKVEKPEKTEKTEKTGSDKSTTTKAETGSSSGSSAKSDSPKAKSA